MMFALLGMVANAAEVTINFADIYGTTTISGIDKESKSMDGFTFSFTKGNSSTAPAYNKVGEIRLYGGKSSTVIDGNTMTVSTEAGRVITKIVLTAGSSATWGELTSNIGSVTEDSSNAIWTGKGSSVTFTANRNSSDLSKSTQNRYASITITYEEVVITQVATPTFSVESGEIYPDTEIAINCATEGATIKYFLDEDITTEYVYSEPLTFDIGTTVTITAWAEAEGLDASEQAVATYNVVEKPATIEFTKVEDLSLLSTNDRVIIVCEDYNNAMSTTVSSNKIEPAEVSIDNGVINLPVNSTAAIFSVTSLGENTFTFSNGSNYLYAADSKSTNLNYSAKTDRIGFTASNSGNGILLTIGTDTRSVLFNGSVFGYYATSNVGSGYYVVSLYKEVVDENQVVAPTFSLTSGTYFKTQELSLSCETEGAKVFYTIDNGEGVSEDREYLEPIQLTNGIYEINAWATKDGFKTSSTVSAIYEIKVIPFEEINVENVKEGKYIIAYNDVETGKSYIMKNEVISDYYVGAEEFDLTTNTPAETDLFVVKQTEGGYTIQNSGNTYVALIQSGKFTNLKPQETDPFVWNFAKSENGNIVATGQGIDSYMSFKMYNTTPEFLAEKNGNYPMFYFVSGTSSVNDAVANEFKAVAVANGIEVNVAEAGLVSVYNAAGQLVANVNVVEGATTINVAGGFYIVKAGNNVAKVLVK